MGLLMLYKSYTSNRASLERRPRGGEAVCKTVVRRHRGFDSLTLHLGEVLWRLKCNLPASGVAA